MRRFSPTIGGYLGSHSDLQATWQAHVCVFETRFFSSIGWAQACCVHFELMYLLLFACQPLDYTPN